MSEFENADRDADEIIVRLRARIDVADAAYQRGEFRKSLGVEAMKADIISRGEARLRRKRETSRLE